MKFKILTKNLMIPFSRQFIDKSDVKSVAHSLKSNFLTQGPKVQIFEKNILKIVKAKYAVATNSGSSALHIACLSIGLKKGDIICSINDIEVDNFGLFNIKWFNEKMRLHDITKTIKLNEIVNVELDIFGKYIYKYTK